VTDLVTTLVATARKPGRPRDARAQAAILEAVLDLVACDGLTQLSMDTIAAKAGVGKATIYRRWPSKEALLVDAWRTLIEPAAVPDTGALRTDVEQILGGMLDRVSSPIADVLPQVLAAARNDPSLAEALRDFLATRRQPMRTVLERAAVRGELPNDVPLDVLQDALIGPVFYRMLFLEQPLQINTIHAMVELVLAGIVPSSRSGTESAR